jgi:hypothetical protein
MAIGLWARPIAQRSVMRRQFNDEYDLVADRWRSRAAMPRGLDHLGVAALGGRIHTTGGFQRSVHADARAQG